MPKYLTKISKFGGQYRVTIPKGLIEEMEWHDVEFVMLEAGDFDQIWVGRFIDGESLKGEDRRDKGGSD